MPVNLQKGQKVSLSKSAPGLTKVVVGLGWDVNQFDTGGDFDLDAAAFLLGEALSSSDQGGDIYHYAGAAGEALFRGKGCSAVLRPGRELELSPMEGNVLVKLLPQVELLPALRRQKGRLQTAGLLCEPGKREELARLLARAGVTRVTRAGSMSAAFPGEAHDGEYPLRRYVRVVDVEL